MSIVLVARAVYLLVLTLLFPGHVWGGQWVDTLSWLRGRQQWKVGADITAPMRNRCPDIPSTRGNLQFSGQFTRNATADLLLGYARRRSGAPGGDGATRDWCSVVVMNDVGQTTILSNVVYTVR